MAQISFFAQVPFPNSEINRLRCNAHPFFTLPQGLVLVYQLSNIDTRTDVPGKFSLRVMAWHALVRYPAILPIVSPQAILHNEWLPRIECLGINLRGTAAGRLGARLQPSRFQAPVPMVRPVKSNHGLLKKVQSLSTPAIQMRTGAASATIRKS